jgi:hypothetical protein
MLLVSSRISLLGCDISPSVIASASEAIHFAEYNGLGLLRRFAPRNDDNIACFLRFLSQTLRATI